MGYQVNFMKETAKPWAFLTSHGVVFVHTALHPDSTIRELAQAVGLTERTVHSILKDLELGGYLMKERMGRRVSYRVNLEAPLLSPSLPDVRVKDLLSALSIQHTPHQADAGRPHRP